MLKEEAKLLFIECDKLFDRAIKESINIGNIRNISSDDFETMVGAIDVYSKLKEQYIEILTVLDKIETIDEKLDKVLTVLEAKES